MKIKSNLLVIGLLVFSSTILASQHQEFKMVSPELITMMENNVVSSTAQTVTIEDDQNSSNRIDDGQSSTEYPQAEIIKPTSIKDLPNNEASVEITTTTEAQIIVSNNQTAWTTSDCFQAIHDENILEREIEKVLDKIRSNLNDSSSAQPNPPKPPTVIKWNIYFTLNINVSSQNPNHTESDSDSFDSGPDILVNGPNETEAKAEQTPSAETGSTVESVDNRKPKNVQTTPIILWICLILLQLEIFLIVGGFISLTFKSQRKWMASLSNRNLMDSGMAIPISRFSSVDSLKHYPTADTQRLPPEIFQQIELNIGRNARPNKYSDTPNKSTAGPSDSNSYWLWARPSTPTNQNRRGNNYNHNRMDDCMMIDHECKL